MKRKILSRTLILSVLFTLVGCSVNSSQIETLGSVPKLEAVSSARAINKNITNVAVVSSIGEATLLGASEFYKHKNIMPANIIVTSTVNVNNFKESSDFGRLFSESMIADFKRLKWNVIDFRGKVPKVAEKQGEFYLNRKELKNIPADSVIFVATYGEYKGGLLINMRILDQNNNVLTASNVQLNDLNSLSLSRKSNCHALGCYVKRKQKRQEPRFSIALKQDDCTNPDRCECTSPNSCLGEKNVLNKKGN